MAQLSIRKLGKYEITEELGRGGFATVYRALDTTLDREVALKVLNPLLMRDPVWVARFQSEARAVARLKHSHSVTVYEIGQAEGMLYIAMELVDGPSLSDLIAQQGRLSWETTLGILAQIADALDYAHGEGVLHRDLKPGNILLDERRGAVLTDFGFAKLVGESSMSVSISGGVVGTPAYIAPEVWDGEEATPQTDLYALACIVYEMLTGDVLFSGNTPSVVMRKHLLDAPQWPAQWPEGVPDDVSRVLSRALAKEPSRRFESLHVFQETLRSTETTGEAEPLSPPGRSLPAEKGKRHVPTWVRMFVGLVGLGAIVILALALLGDNTQPTVSVFGTPSTITPSVTASLSPTVPTKTPTRAPTAFRTPRPTSKAPATATPTATVTRTPSATPSPVPSPTPSIAPSRTPTARPRPTATPKPSLDCDPSKANAEVFAEIIYPQQGMVVKPKIDGTLDIIGTAAGSAFTRLTFFISVEWCPAGAWSRACDVYWTAEFYEPVVCGKLITLDTSTWGCAKSSDGRCSVFIQLNSVKPDSNYHQTWIRFYVER